MGRVYTIRTIPKSWPLPASPASHAVISLFDTQILFIKPADAILFSCSLDQSRSQGQLSSLYTSACNDIPVL